MKIVNKRGLAPTAPYQPIVRPLVVRETSRWGFVRWMSQEKSFFKSGN